MESREMIIISPSHLANAVHFGEANIVWPLPKTEDSPDIQSICRSFS